MEAPAARLPLPKPISRQWSAPAFGELMAAARWVMLEQPSGDQSHLVLLVVTPLWSVIQWRTFMVDRSTAVPRVFTNSRAGLVWWSPGAELLVRYWALSAPGSALPSSPPPGSQGTVA